MASILKIPVSSAETSSKLRVDLEGRSYILRFDWNERMSRWIMGVYDADEVPIVLGIVLNIDSSLLTLYTNDKLPPGEMILFDTSEKHEECGRKDLGVRCELLYQTRL